MKVRRKQRNVDRVYKNMCNMVGNNNTYRSSGMNGEGEGEMMPEWLIILHKQMNKRKI